MKYTEEEKNNIEIINNLKKYFQNNIDKGYSKFVYNDYGLDEKNIDILNALDYFLENNTKQQKEDVKDIRVMFDTFQKQNVNYIEILFTDYHILDAKYSEYIEELLKNAELIAHLNYNQALKCMAGMSMEKLKALQHPYPTIVDKIEKYGYDPKQLHHILRMNDFIKKYVSGKTYKECLIPNNKEYLIEIKKGKLCCNDAVKLANEIDKETHKIMKENLSKEDNINTKAVELLDNIKYLIIRKSLKEELKNEK